MIKMPRIAGGKWSVLAFCYIGAIYFFYQSDVILSRINSPLVLLLVSSAATLAFPAFLLAALHSVSVVEPKTLRSISGVIAIWAVWIIVVVGVLAANATLALAHPVMEGLKEAALRDFFSEAKSALGY